MNYTRITSFYQDNQMIFDLPYDCKNMPAYIKDFAISRFVQVIHRLKYDWKLIRVELSCILMIISSNKINAKRWNFWEKLSDKIVGISNQYISINFLFIVNFLESAWFPLINISKHCSGIQIVFILQIFCFLQKSSSRF